MSFRDFSNRTRDRAPAPYTWGCRSSMYLPVPSCCLVFLPAPSIAVSSSLFRLHFIFISAAARRRRDLRSNFRRGRHCTGPEVRSAASTGLRNGITGAGWVLAAAGCEGACGKAGSRYPEGLTHNGLLWYNPTKNGENELHHQRANGSEHSSVFASQVPGWNSDLPMVDVTFLVGSYHNSLHPFAWYCVFHTHQRIAGFRQRPWMRTAGGKNGKRFHEKRHVRD